MNEISENPQSQNPGANPVPKYSCGNCLFAWHMENAPAALCRRFPPEVYQADVDVTRNEEGKVLNAHQTLSQFPVVMLSNWCGEHKREKPGARA